jgi:hypothetical protein
MVSSQLSALSLRGRQLTLHQLFFFVARFEAFNGSTVPAPANPRRSRGGRFD